MVSLPCFFGCAEPWPHSQQIFGWKGKEKRKDMGFRGTCFCAPSHEFQFTPFRKRKREEERHNPRKWSFLVLRHMYV
jgi:hypothetical protein